MDVLTIKRMMTGFVIVYPGPDGRGEFVRVVPTTEALVQHVAAWTRSAPGAIAGGELSSSRQESLA